MGSNLVSMRWSVPGGLDVRRQVSSAPLYVVWLPRQKKGAFLHGEGVDGSTDSCGHWALISFDVTCEQATRFPSIPLDYREDSKSTLRPRRDLEKMAGLREFLIDGAGRSRLVRGKNPDPPCLLTSKTLSRFYMSSVVLRLE